MFPWGPHICVTGTLSQYQAQNVSELLISFTVIYFISRQCSGTMLYFSTSAGCHVLYYDMSILLARMYRMHMYLFVSSVKIPFV
jgi:hypothetical protein